MTATCERGELRVVQESGCLSTHGTARRAALAAGLLSVLPLWAGQRRKLTVAAFPNVDAIVRAAVPQWQRRHPEIDIEVVSRQYIDHHTAMTTALSTSVYLPDVMALESSYVGRFAQGGGLEDLSRAPYHVDQLRARYVAYAYDQAINRRGEVVAVPTDIGPGTMIYRADILSKAGLTDTDLTPTLPRSVPIASVRLYDVARNCMPNDVFDTRSGEMLRVTVAS